MAAWGGRGLNPALDIENDKKWVRPVGLEFWREVRPADGNLGLHPLQTCSPPVRLESLWGRVGAEDQGGAGLQRRLGGGSGWTLSGGWWKASPTWLRAEAVGAPHAEHFSCVDAWEPDNSCGIIRG